jgi:TetR/AcrR family transcriptional repressor of nem operon
MSTLTYSPEKTRNDLLNAAFEEIWRSGFRAASLDAILGKAGVTKGALYHHFRNKKELGYAVVEEVVRQKVRKQWIDPLWEADNPIDALLSIRKNIPEEEWKDICRYGCHLNNLAQEMSPIDEGFRRRLNEIFQEWAKGIADALRRGQEYGSVRDNINPNHAATFMIAVCEGAVSMAKNAQAQDVLDPCWQGLTYYLEALRPRRSFRSE